MLKKILQLSCPMTVFPLVVFCLLNFQGNSCLKDVHINVPTAVKVGGNITVNCSYTLENETLYTVKYYLGDKEFYRYSPEDEPSVQTFTVFGDPWQIIIDDDVVVLLGVAIDSTGFYKCEVTIDSPLFFTVEDSGYVTVVEEPEGPPTISMQSKGFKVGNVVKASCTSRGGFPLANLTWFVDGEQVTYPDMSRAKQYTVQGDVDSSVSELTLPVVSASSNGQFHLRCEASQFNLYNASADAVFEEETSPSSSTLSYPFTSDVRGRRSMMLSAVLAAAAMSILHHSLTFILVDLI